MSCTVVLMPAGNTAGLAFAHDAAGDLSAQAAKSCSRALVGLFGRFTTETGKRSALRFQSLAMWTVSRCASRVGPSNHGMRLDNSTTLSPLSALMGMNFTSRNTSSFGMNLRIHREFPNNVLAPIHESILLMAMTRCGMPRSAAM